MTTSNTQTRRIAAVLASLATTWVLFSAVVGLADTPAPNAWLAQAAVATVQR